MTVQAFAQRLADRFEVRALEYEREAEQTRRDYPGEIGRNAAALDHRKACDYREIAKLVRDAAKEPT